MPAVWRASALHVLTGWSRMVSLRACETLRQPDVGLPFVWNWSNCPPILRQRASLHGMRSRADALSKLFRRLAGGAAWKIRRIYGVRPLSRLFRQGEEREAPCPAIGEVFVAQVPKARWLIDEWSLVFRARPDFQKSENS